MKKDTRYNGWKNYETWNVVLHLQNTYYYKVVDYLDFCLEENLYLKDISYKNFIYMYNLEKEFTSEDVYFLDKTLSYNELNSVLKDWFKGNKEGDSK